MAKQSRKAKKDPVLNIKYYYDLKKDRLEKAGGTFSWREFGYAMGLGNLEGSTSSRSNIAKLFQEDFNPTFKKLITIAKALDVSVKDLIED